ncbi:MAG TPA: DUF3999 family protein [Thermoanaerobaculia bacterium]|nr:DUF3999 family protein [Thermoanaerobaculia bacterium]
MATVAFSHERTVTPGARGANRLDVDVTLLAGAQNDLRDLRLLDAQQREVGYLLVKSDEQPRWTGGRMLPIAATRRTSGFEADFGRATTIDRVRLDGIAAPFLKRVTVEGSGDRARWTLLADATVFDLPDQELRLTEVAFAPGAYRYLRFVWDDRSSAPVRAGGVSAREHDSAARPEPLRFATVFAKRASEPGKSRYRITLPGPHLPITHLEVDVAGGNVFRTAKITEPRLGRGIVEPQDLGSAKLKRAERDGVVAAEMSVPIAAPGGRQLDLEIDDANNPPLNITAIRARLAPQPWIYFESPDGAPLTARYGNASVLPPLYDLEAYRSYVSTKAVASAKWGQRRTGFSPSGRAEARPTFGSVIERDQFRVSRRVPDAKGLSVLLLDAHVLAHSNELRDLRLADGQGRQVPYLVEHRAEPLTLKLAVPPRAASGSKSTYRLELPYANLPSGTLVLTTSERVFDRDVTVRQRRGGIIASSAWRSGEPEEPPPAVRIELPHHPPRTLELIIDEGDNAPLPIESAHLLLPSEALRFSHPGTPLFLFYGNRRVNAPRYDLALLAPRLFAEPARELSLGAAPGVRVADDDRDGRKLFWIGVVIAAVVLVLLLLRLVLVSPETSRAPSDTT